MSDHITPELVEQVAQAIYPDLNHLHRDDRGFRILDTEEELRAAIPVLLAAGWMPPREVHSAANDLTGLAARDDARRGGDCE